MARIAEDRGCQVDDLSVGLVTAVTNFGLEVARIMSGGDDIDACDRPTRPDDVLKAITDEERPTDHAALAPQKVPEEFFAPNEHLTPAERPKKRKMSKPPGEKR